MRTLLVGSVLMVLVGAAPFAAAQPAKKTPAKKGPAEPAANQPAAAAPGVRFVPLLAAPDVQADLKLPADVVGKLKAIFAERENAIRTTVKGGGAGRERAEKVRAVSDEYYGKAAALIKPEQLARLRQIYLQARGGESFVERDMAETLKLEPQQRQEISLVMQELALAKGRYAREFLGQVNFTDKAEHKARSEFLPKFVALLKPEQQKIWARETGARFTGEVPLSALVPAANQR